VWWNPSLELSTVGSASLRLDVITADTGTIEKRRVGRRVVLPVPGLPKQGNRSRFNARTRVKFP